MTPSDYTWRIVEPFLVDLLAVLAPSKVGREAGGQPDPISRGSGTKGPSQRQKASRLLSFDCAAAHFVMNHVDGCSSGSGRDI